jgi:hypothetical protein
LSGAKAARDEGAGMTAERIAHEVVYPVVKAETSAVTLAFPSRMPAVTFTTMKLWPAGMMAELTLTIELCDDEMLTGTENGAIAGEP